MYVRLEIKISTMERNAYLVVNFLLFGELLGVIIPWKNTLNLIGSL